MSSDAGAGDGPSVWDRLADIPDLEAEAGEPGTAPRTVDAVDSDSGAATPPEERTFDARHIAVPVATRTEPTDPAGPMEAVPTVRPAPPGPAPDAEAPPPTRRRRRRRRWALALVVPLLLIAAMGLYALVLWGRIDRIETADTLSAADGGFTNYLIVGTDSRANVDPDDPAADDLGLGIEGNRADSIIVLHVGSTGNRMVSLPRDLLVEIPGNGVNRLNSARAWGGAPLLVETVRDALDVPIHRYFEVDLAGFMDVVDAVGGVTVDFDAGACDVKSGLFVAEVGAVRLDREQALEYVRSRNYTEFDPAAAVGMTTCAEVQAAGLGRPAGDDLDRTARQRDVLLRTLNEAAGSWNPLQLLDVLSGLSGGLKIDDQMGFGDALDLARTARNLDAENHALPVDRAGPALVLNDQSAAVLDLFRPR